MDLMEQTLRAVLPELGLRLSEQQIGTLCDFGRAVVKQNEVMNLTAITEDTQGARLHLLDRLTVPTASDPDG